MTDFHQPEGLQFGTRLDYYTGHRFFSADTFWAHRSLYPEKLIS